MPYASAAAMMIRLRCTSARPLHTIQRHARYMRDAFDYAMIYARHYAAIRHTMHAI